MWGIIRNYGKKAGGAVRRGTEAWGLPVSDSDCVQRAGEDESRSFSLKGDGAVIDTGLTEVHGFGAFGSPLPVQGESTVKPRRTFPFSEFSEAGCASHVDATCR
jgi:hypothetical protein